MGENPLILVRWQHYACTQLSPPPVFFLAARKKRHYPVPLHFPAKQQRKTGWKHSFPRSTHINTTVVSPSRLKIYSIGHEEARKSVCGREQRFVRCSIRRLVTLVNQAYRRDPGFLSLGNTKYGLLRGALCLLRNCSWTRFDLRNARRSINYRPVKRVPSLWKWSLIDRYIFLWRKCRIA